MRLAEKILLEEYGCKTIEELQDYLGMNVSIEMILQSMEKYAKLRKILPPQTATWTPEWKSDYA